MRIKDQSEQLINRNLLALLAVIFLFYGGLSCLYSTFVPHLLELGLTLAEISQILTVVALVSIIGPIIFGLLADRISDRHKTSYGRYLQTIIAILLILGAIAYGLLTLVPKVIRLPTQEVPIVSFGCDKTGAFILQGIFDFVFFFYFSIKWFISINHHRSSEFILTQNLSFCPQNFSHFFFLQIFQGRCSEEKTCFHWEEKQIGSLVLTNCSYTCQKPDEFKPLYVQWLKKSLTSPAELSSREDASDNLDYLDKR